MDFELIPKKRKEPIDDKITVPVPRGMKLKLERMKDTEEVNEMTRKFFEMIIETFEKKSKKVS